MMSKKWTFSFLTLMLVGFLVIAPAALANTIKLRVHDANHDEGPKDPADVSAEDGIQVIAGTAATIRLDAEEPLVVPEDAEGIFEVVGANINDAATFEPSEGNKRLTITLAATPTTDFDAGSEVTIFLLPNTLQSATTGDTDSSGATLKFKYVAIDNSDADAEIDEPNPPKVVSITRATAIGSTIASAFIEEAVSGEFMVKIVLTEQPNGGLHSAKLADRIKAVSASNATVTNVVIGRKIDRGAAADNNPLPEDDGGYDADATTPDPIPDPTGRDNHYYTYLATIAPSGAKTPVVVQVNSFKDLVLTQGEGTDIVEPGEYKKPSEKGAASNRDKLEVKVVVNPAAAKTAGLSVDIPNDIIIPANGYLVVAKDDGDGDDNHEKRTDSTAILYPGDPKDAEILDNERPPAQRMYNVIKADLPNLETFLINGGTIVLMTDAPDAQLAISEIMWGTDASLAKPASNQWIEIRNPLATQYKTKDVKLVFYGAGAADQAAVAAAKLEIGKYTDAVGTVGAGGYWSIAGIGQGGRTGLGEAPGDLIAVTPTQSIISMQRALDQSGNPGSTTDATVGSDGTLAKNWAPSTGAPLNFDVKKEGTRIGTPGAAPTAYPVTPTPVEKPKDAPVIPVAAAADIMITEIMVDTGNGRLPQWIELTNVSGAEKSLAGWSVEISNSAADTDVIGRKLSINLSGTLGVGGGTGAGGTMGKSLLLVAWGARSSSNLSGSDRVINVSSKVNGKGRYKLISDMAFMITLLPPQTSGIIEDGDTAGNLGASPAWELPMAEAARSSLIRREMLADGMATMGISVDGWVLASTTDLVTGEATWYGSDEDAGTPGHDAGGPLPVELSHFRPARDKATGAVVITWATQSELNNAGFFIKRSNQRNGQFKIVNPTMIPGAGTTSEKQFYTYTDTTAQPNVVYYYQIEDVSLDGNRQTLTRGIRLKGHIGAAGKATVIWGEIKASNE